jgi:mannose-6-phosphate isomerase-like protein (cupin superfamily)
MPGPLTRRIVTGHDVKGSSVIERDDVVTGERGTLIWTTDSFPVDNLHPDDGGLREIGIALKGGTVCWILEIPPNSQPMMHRTFTVDYDIVLDGEVDMELDGGESVHLKPGDVVVQRGTNHAWVNRGDRPCRMAAVLIDAKPIEINGRILEGIA